MSLNAHLIFDLTTTTNNIQNIEQYFFEKKTAEELPRNDCLGQKSKFENFSRDVCKKRVDAGTDEPGGGFCSRLALQPNPV